MIAEEGMRNMFGMGITEGFHFLVTEDGITKHCVTDMEQEKLVETFHEVESVEELFKLIEAMGYKANFTRPAIQLNFDKE